ncbi:MAG: single-stranded-DNA-specific exonuclease RecJ [Chloroflexota bacterium]
MTPTTKRWQIAPRISPETERELHGYPTILRQILYNRGYATHEAARRYLEGKQPPGTEPANLCGLPEAVDRLRRAIQQHEKIAIYGDYDVDGVTATALLVLYLRSLGADAEGYIPNRFDEGYGLNIGAIKRLKDQGVNLVITVDCGIRSLEEADYARSLGLDLIISDHHHPGAELPNALAIIDPKQPGDTYPEKDLAGVGLAYKLAAGLSAHPEGLNIPTDDLLDLVALGTVADLVPLVGENRFLVREGLQRIRCPRRQGLMALIGVAGLKPGEITATDIGFALGPRLNAAGRMDSALTALKLLSTQNVLEAGQLAQQLEIQNRERQKITRGIQARAEELAILDDPDSLLLFAAHPDFNPGVVGLAASRLADQYYRPAIVGQIGDEFTRASCRSISEFHITAALDQCADLLKYHGGHAAAAGFTIRNENVPELIERLKAIASEQLSELDLRPTINADVEVSLSELKPEVLEHLQWMQPTGYGNPGAIFASRGLKVTSSKTVGKESDHLKFTVSDGWFTFDAIAFRQGHWQTQMPKRVDLMYAFEVNEFGGRKTLQLNVRDIRPSS